jgi:hypothetical protein
MAPLLPASSVASRLRSTLRTSEDRWVSAVIQATATWGKHQRGDVRVTGTRKIRRTGGGDVLCPAPLVQVVDVNVRETLAHHAEIIALKGDSYRLRDKDLGSAARAE